MYSWLTYLTLFQDLKKYHYYYWFCFPCLCPSTDITFDQEPKKLKDKLTPEEVGEIQYLLYEELKFYTFNMSMWIHCIIFILNSLMI